MEEKRILCGSKELKATKLCINNDVICASQTKGTNISVQENRQMWKGINSSIYFARSNTYVYMSDDYKDQK